MQDIQNKIYKNDVLLNNNTVSWIDIFYAVKENLFSPNIIKEYAGKIIEENSSEDIYKILLSETPEESLILLEKKMNQQKKINEDEKKHSLRVIRFFVLKNILDKKSITLLEEAAAFYEDLGCPEDMENFIYYMPVNDGYKPEKHTKKENEDRMLSKMKIFIENEKKNLKINE